MQQYAIKNPKVLLVGGPDVDGRIPIINKLKQKYDFLVAGSYEQSALPFEQAEIEFVHYHLNRGANPLYDLQTVTALIGLMKNHRVDIVHTFDTKPNVWGRLAAWFCGVPIIIGTVPGLGALYANEGTLYQLARTIYQPLQKFASQKSNLTIFQNSDDQQQFIDLGIVPSEKTMVINGSGIDTSLYNPASFSNADRQRLRQKLSIPEKAIVVTMIARVVQSKGVLEFADAANILKAQFPNLYFLLVGPMDGRGPEQLTEAQIKILQTSVNWIGKRSDIPEILNATDIFTLPSNYREGVPRVLLEAGAMALPLITTNSPGCNKVVLDKQTGLLIPNHDSVALANAITKLTLSPQLRFSLGYAAQKHVKSVFELSIIAQQTDDLYQDILTQTQYQTQFNLAKIES